MDHEASAKLVREGKRSVGLHYALLKVEADLAANAAHTPGASTDYGPMPDMAAKLRALVEEDRAQKAKNEKRR